MKNTMTELESLLEGANNSFHTRRDRLPKLKINWDDLTAMMGKDWSLQLGTRNSTHVEPGISKYDAREKI